MSLRCLRYGMPISLVLWALIILAILTATAHASVNVSGTIKDPSGAVASNSFVRFQLMNTGNNQCSVAGTFLGKYTVDFPADMTTGAISGTLYRTDTEISCGGFFTSRYNMTVYQKGVPSSPTKCIVVNGDFNIASPVYCTDQVGAPALPAPQFVQTNPSTSQVVVQPPGSQFQINGNSAFTGSVNDISSLTLSFLDARYALAGLTNVTNPGSGYKLPGTYVDWSNPGTLGATTPNTGAFTTLSSTSMTTKVVNGSVFNVLGYGAKCDGVTDDHVALQAATTDALAAHGVVYFPASAGACATSVPIKTNPTLDTVNQPARIAFVGDPGSPAFGTATMPSTVKALSGIASGEPVFDLRLTKQIEFANLGVDCNSVSGVNGVEFGRRDVTTGVSLDSTIENNAIANCNYGIRVWNASILRAKGNVVRANQTGILAYYVGDADFANNYINLNVPDHALSSPLDNVGTGIFLNVCGNINIHGGKIEWNAVGVMLYDSYGVNISGINWDTNRTHHITIIGDNALAGSSPAGRYSTSISISGNRFLGGATNSDGSLQKAAIGALASTTGGKVEASITGNTFRKGGPGAIDDDPTAPAGPVDDAIEAASSNGSVNLGVVGNDFINGANTNAVSSLGAGAVVTFGINQTNLSNSTASSGIIVTTEDSNHWHTASRTASCTTAASANATCTTTINWSSAFADTAYTPLCSVESISGAAYMVNTVNASKAAGSILVTIQNIPGSSVASQVFIDCLARHD